MTDLREDVLAALPPAARIRREREDAAYLTKHTAAYADPESLKRDRNTWVGVDDAIKKADLKPMPAGAKLDFCVCARVDLDHPIYFPDNRFADCADCGCRLQYRPTLPSGTKLCVCCAARRAREAPDE